jgi:thioredoxin-dependent peroxiredoxin
MNPGEPAPDFSATDDNGQPVSLRGLRGKWVVLYFFPKAAAYSMGCALETQKFESILPDLHALNAEVIGVSTDSSAAQSKFKTMCKSSFPMLSDSDKTIGKAYGVLGGLLSFLGPDRQTFLIDPNGQIAQRWKVANIMIHAVQVKQEIEARVAAVA